MALVWKSRKLAQAIAFFFFAEPKQHLGSVICSSNAAFLLACQMLWSPYLYDNRKSEELLSTLHADECLRGPKRTFPWKGKKRLLAKKSRHDRHNYNEAWSERDAALDVPVPWRMGSVVITRGLANYSTGSPHWQKEQPIKTWRQGAYAPMQKRLEWDAKNFRLLYAMYPPRFS